MRRIVFEHPTFSYSHCLAFSPDGEKLAFDRGGGDLLVLNPNTGKHDVLKGHTVTLNAVAFSRDGKTLASASMDTTVKLWQVATGRELLTLRHSEPVNALAFTNDGLTLATGSKHGEHGLVSFWKADAVDDTTSTWCDPTDGGYAQIVTRKNEWGKPIENAYLDEQGKRVAGPGNIARDRLLYDAAGNNIETAWFDATDMPVRGPEGYACQKMRYDERGKVTEKSFHGLDGKLVCIKAGYAKVRSKYDDDGNLTEIATYDENDHLVLSKEGFATMRLTYDKGSIIDKSFFDADGALLPIEVVVIRVRPDGPGERLGIKEGDVLVSYDGHALTSVKQFIMAKQAETRDNQFRELRVMRHGKLITFQRLPHCCWSISPHALFSRAELLGTGAYPSVGADASAARERVAGSRVGVQR